MTGRSTSRSPGFGGALVLLLAVSALHAQTRPDYLARAREQLSQRNSDSALALLRLVTDSQSGEPVARRVEAWILTGVVSFYRGEDSSVVAAFRSAFALDPGVRAAGLSAIDSSLAATFEAQRPKADAAMLPAPGSADSVYECVKRCPAGVSKPSLSHFPQVSPQDVPPSESQIYPGASGLGASGLRGAIEFHFIVNEAGSVEPGSVEVSMSTARRWQPAFLQGLLQARFLPAMLGPRPVRARVRLRVDINAEGLDHFRYNLAGP
jgi:hypothetical protein